MKKIAKIETAFEEAFDKIALASWNRQRSDAELQDFLLRRQEVVADIDLGL